ncbi:hypothetical protein [Psychroserpens damuponensis]|uniref:hypothetical protein n=1 Tax=Psychroserpens damuponensis TaxID=943936 RepID=UPI00058FDB77|nr:hypothetical protein [Psychroserpens damuponensis]
MKNLIFAFILIGQFTFSYSQSEFENAINSLHKELGFNNTSESFSIGTKPKDNFVNQLKECGEEKELEILSKLNFNSIRFATSAELSTHNWIEKYVIKFKEWQFGSKKEASKFRRILDRLNHSQIRSCINERGIIWWKNKNRIYILISQAETIHQNKIKQVIISGLKK